jgi:predicted metal-dependent phosphoesterase TrpH
LLKADLHVHTEYSVDCNTPLDKIVSRCLEVGINCLAISDHGTTEGALKMREMAPFKVIVAEEIMTPDGEIMGMFLKKTIPSRLPVEEVIAQIRAQGGLICIPHPFDFLRSSALRNNMIEKIVDQIDMVEVFNSRIFFPQTSAKALAFAQKHGIIKSAGSDAHTLREIGNAYVEMPDFKGKDDFLQALKRGKITGRVTNPFIHFASAWTKLRKQRKQRRG